MEKIKEKARSIRDLGGASILQSKHVLNLAKIRTVPYNPHLNILWLGLLLKSAVSSLVFFLF